MIDRGSECNKEIRAKQSRQEEMKKLVLCSSLPRLLRRGRGIMLMKEKLHFLLFRSTSIVPQLFVNLLLLLL